MIDEVDFTTSALHCSFTTTFGLGSLASAALAMILRTALAGYPTGKWKDWEWERIGIGATEWETCTFVNGCHEGYGWAMFDPTSGDLDHEEWKAGVHRDSRDGVSVHAAPKTPMRFAEMLAKGGVVVV